MELSAFLGTFVFSVVVFFAIDMVWLTRFAKNFYIKNIGVILRRNAAGKLAPRWVEAIAFYLLYVLGTVFFGVRMSLISGENALNALVYGALFGFFAYATYDLTNRATIETFPLKVVVIDLIWGAFISGTVSLAGFLFATAFLV